VRACVCVCVRVLYVMYALYLHIYVSYRAYAVSKTVAVPLQRRWLVDSPSFSAGEGIGWNIGQRANTMVTESNYVRIDVQSHNKFKIVCKRASNGEQVGFENQVLGWDY